MKLSEFVTENNETNQQFYNRTVWNCETVMVFDNQNCKHDPNSEPVAIWDLERARRYIEQLRAEPEQFEPVEIDYEWNTEAEKELIEIDDVSEIRWVDSISGEIVHRFAKGGEEKWK